MSGPSTRLPSPTAPPRPRCARFWPSADRRTAILGEEADDVPGESGLTWVLDPIDGTRGFIAGTPTWGVLIALCDAEGPIYGIIDQPYIGERFEGGLGRARLTGPRGARPLSVEPAASLAEATLFTTFPEVGTEADRAGFEMVRDAVKLTRYGMDCYAYALIAAGHVDLVIEAGLHPYDICAPIAVIEAAGGVVTDWSGGAGPWRRAGAGRLQRALHAEALALLADVPRGECAPDPERRVRRHHGRRRGGASGHRYPDRQRRNHRAWPRA
jgi:histidinol phosphatase-like enzyme (inositol monophosphatase family)